MSGFEHGFLGLGPLMGAAALPIWLAAAAFAALFVGALLFGRGLQIGIGGLLGRGALAIGCTLLVWLMLAGSGAREQATARRALDARAAELTARTITPGSALACLDAIANAAVEAACEKALFAAPEGIAAAVAYVDARLALLADGLELAAHDPAYAATLERSRRALEADRFGVVAHALATRGCTAADCAAFALFRDKSRVAANLAERTFDANVVMHSAAWRNEGLAVAAISPSSSAPTVSTPAADAALAAMPPSVPSGHPVSSKYDFPSASSIPAVSIMEPEPPRPPDPVAAPRSASAPSAAPPRRQTAREPGPAASPPPVAPMPLSPPAAAPATDGWQGVR